MARTPNLKKVPLSMVVRGATGIGVALIATGMSTTAAEAALNDGVFVNGGTRSFSICRDAASETSCGSGLGTLLAGQNSKTKYGWADTDMIYIPSKCTLQEYTWSQSSMRWINYALGGSSGRWMKIGGLNGTAVQFRVVC